MARFIIHKPAGCLSQLLTKQRKQQKKKLLSGLYDFPEGTMVIGRLDYYSEGLLLLTTDGKISNQVRSRNVEKEYLAELDGKIGNEATLRLIRTRIGHIKISNLSAGNVVEVDDFGFKS